MSKTVRIKLRGQLMHDLLDFANKAEMSMEEFATRSMIFAVNESYRRAAAMQAAQANLVGNGGVEGEVTAGVNQQVFQQGESATDSGALADQADTQDQVASGPESVYSGAAGGEGLVLPGNSAPELDSAAGQV